MTEAVGLVLRMLWIWSATQQLQQDF